MGTFRTLKDEILSGESPTLEFKCDIPEQAIKYLKTVCAFANCLGGRIVFGVDTDLSIVGMSDPFVARDRIADAIANGIEPMIVPDISFQTVDGKTLVVVEIAQSPRCPHWVKRLGRENGTFVRYDATTRAADADVLRELVYDGSDRGFDAAQCRLLELTSRKIAALCRRLRAKALASCETVAQRQAVHVITKEKLEDWGVLTRRAGKLVPTNAFALLGGDAAVPACVKCGIFRGTEHRRILDRRTFRGPIQDQIDAVYEWLLSKINMAAVVKGVYRHDVYEFPEGALRELITNAVMHRNYAVYGSDIQVALYDDRLEIVSPGGLPRGMTVVRMQAGCSRCRNKAIAEAFAYMRVAETWGLGVPNVMREFERYGLEAPEYTDWGNAVRVTLRRRQAGQTTKGNGRLKDSSSSPTTSQTTSQVTLQTTPQTTSQVGLLKGLGENTRRVLALLTAEPCLSTEEAAQRLECKKDTLRYHVKILRKTVGLKHIGGTKRGRWIVEDETASVG